MYGSRLSDCGMFRISVVNLDDKFTVIGIELMYSINIVTGNTDLKNDFRLKATVTEYGDIFIAETVTKPTMTKQEFHIYAKWIYNLHYISQNFDQYLASLKV